MDFAIPDMLAHGQERFKAFLKAQLLPNLSEWYRKKPV